MTTLPVVASFAALAAGPAAACGWNREARGPACRQRDSGHPAASQTGSPQPTHVVVERAR
jgi:hypothetical protein